MENERSRPPVHLTFSQRHEYEPLPEPMQLENISQDLRRAIWNAIRNLFLGVQKSAYGEYFFDSNEKRFIERFLGEFFSKPESNISTDYEDVIKVCKRAILESKFNKILDFLEIMLNDEYIMMNFAERIKRLFKKHAAPYWLDISQQPYQFFPQCNESQGEAIQKAIETLLNNNMGGAVAHLRQAAEHINAQQYADSIADSIHAVESAACTIDPKASKTLKPALNSLEKTGLLNHQALKEAFNKLYGYTSDEQGIRHALLDETKTNVGLDEAMFMYGACASFAAYLVNKGQQTTSGNI